MHLRRECYTAESKPHNRRGTSGEASHLNTEDSGSSRIRLRSCHSSAGFAREMPTLAACSSLSRSRKQARSLPSSAAARCFSSVAVGSGSGIRLQQYREPLHIFWTRQVCLSSCQSSFFACTLWVVGRLGRLLLLCARDTGVALLLLCARDAGVALLLLCVRDAGVALGHACLADFGAATLSSSVLCRFRPRLSCLIEGLGKEGWCAAGAAGCSWRVGLLGAGAPGGAKLTMLL